MAVAWFIAPYTLGAFDDGTPYRYVCVDDFTAQVWADNGHPEGNDGTSGPYWAEAECLGGYAVVKVRASPTTLAAINAVPGVLRIPVARLDDPLSTLTAAQKSAAVAKLRALGYSLAEVQAAFPGDLGAYTLGDVLRFALRRRLRARLDAVLGIVLDGQVDPTTPVEVVDATVA